MSNALRVAPLAFCLSFASLHSAEKPPVAFVADFTYLSQYIAHGFDLSNGSPVGQVTLLANHVLIENLEVGYVYSYTFERDDKNWDETGPAIRYSRQFFAEKPYALKGFASAYYFSYPHWEVGFNKNFEPIGNTRLRALKLQTGWVMPNLFKIDSVALVPGYTFTNWQSVKKNLLEDGSLHELAMTAVVPLECLDGQSLSIKAAANYHTGVLGVEEGWSHYTLQADTTFLWKGLFTKPGLNYQWSKEDTVNPDDEFWLSLSVTKLF